MGRLLGRERLCGSSRVSRRAGSGCQGALEGTRGAGRGSHCSQEVRSALARNESCSLQPGVESQLPGGSDSESLLADAVAQTLLAGNLQAVEAHILQAVVDSRHPEH